MSSPKEGGKGLDMLDYTYAFQKGKSDFISPVIKLSCKVLVTSHVDYYVDYWDSTLILANMCTRREPLALPVAYAPCCLLFSCSLR